MQGLFLTLFWIGFLGFFVCLVMMVVSLIKKNGQFKRFALFTVCSIVLVIISTFGIEPSKNKPITAKQVKQGQEARQVKQEQEVKQAVESKKDEDVSPSTIPQPRLSQAQLEVINNFQKQDFEEFTKAYYSLTLDEQKEIYLDYLHEKEVTWSGTIIKDGVLSSQVFVYGYSGGYNGETWEQIENTRMASLMFFAKVDDDKVMELLKPGDKVSFKGIIGINGKQEKDDGEGINKRWKLYNAEVISINGRTLN